MHMLYTNLNKKRKKISLTEVNTGLLLTVRFKTPWAIRYRYTYSSILTQLNESYDSTSFNPEYCNITIIHQCTFTITTWRQFTYMEI